MRLLVIGLDQDVLNPGSGSSQRQLKYFEGFEADILVLGTGSREEVRLSSTVRVFRPGGRTFVNAIWGTWRSAWGMLHRNSYDVMTVQDPFLCATIGYFARGRRSVALHIQDHSAAFARPAFGAKEKLLKGLACFLARRADRVRTVSERGRRGLLQIGVSAERIDVIFVATPTEHLLDLTHPTTDQPHILCVSRLSREKGMDLLLSAFAQVIKRRSSARLTIVGEGPERTTLERQARELGIKAAVTFAGQQNDLRSFYQAATLYVQPSRFEGWGRTVIEAAAAGLPIVMTDVGCAGEVIVNGKSGIVVPPENVQALSAAMVGLIDDPTRAKQLAHGARESVQHLPTIAQAISSVRVSLEKTTKTNASKSLWPLFLASFAIRALVFVVILAFVGPKGFELGDTIQYLGLARSLLTGHGFSLDGVPFFYRTIGYPLFLAGGLVVFRSTTIFVFFQMLLASFIPLVMLRVGQQLRLGKRAAWIAAWIAAFEPHLVYYSVTIVTESVYTLIFLIGLVYIFRTMETKRAADSLRAGIAFGLGMLIKPLLQFFPPVLLIFMLPWWPHINWRKVVKHSVIILSTVLITVAPWMYRNYRVFHNWSLSSQGQTVALFYLGTSIVSMRDHLTYQDAEAKVKEQFNQAHRNEMTEAERITAFKQAGMEYLKENPGILARLIAINTFTFWTSSNYNGFLNYYRLIPRIDHSVLPPTHYLAQGRIGDFFGAFWKIFLQPFYAIGILGRLIWLAVTFFFIVGLIAAYRRIPDRRLQLVFLLALCAYMTAVVWVDGLGIESRLRYPLMPIEFLYATYGALMFLKRSHRKSKV